jgi:hypothetical protein
MQPLDVLFFKSFNSICDRGVKCWLRNHPGRVITIYQIPQLAAEAFSKSATVSIAVNGLWTTSISPFNDKVFEEAEFASDITSNDATIAASGSQFDSPARISPLPTLPKKITNRSGSAETLTSYVLVDLDTESQNDYLLEPSNADVTSSKQKHHCECASPSATTLAEITAASTSHGVASASTSTRVTSSYHKRYHPDASGASTSLALFTSKSSRMEGSADVACIYCCESFCNSKRGEKWVQCGVCQNGAHEQFAEYASGGYRCDLCF